VIDGRGREAIPLEEEISEFLTDDGKTLGITRRRRRKEEEEEEEGCSSN